MFAVKGITNPLNRQAKEEQLTSGRRAQICHGHAASHVVVEAGTADDGKRIEKEIVDVAERHDPARPEVDGQLAAPGTASKHAAATEVGAGELLVSDCGLGDPAVEEELRHDDEIAR